MFTGSSLNFLCPCSVDENQSQAKEEQEEKSWFSRHTT